MPFVFTFSYPVFVCIVRYLFDITKSYDNNMAYSLIYTFEGKPEICDILHLSGLRASRTRRVCQRGGGAQYGEWLHPGPIV